MIWKCKILNGAAGWTEVEIVGDDFLVEFRRRFGDLRYRDVKEFDYFKGEWKRVWVE